jgi:hypothetical protein
VSEEQPILTKRQRREQALPLDDVQRSLAERVITELGEEEESAHRQIEALVYYCGVEMIERTLEETHRVESEGGLTVKSGDRRRTPGGVFLFLMNQQITPEIRRETIYLYQPKKNNKNKPKKAASAQQRQKAKTNAPEWNYYHKSLNELLDRRGVVTTVKITLIGRPGAAKIVQDTVMTTVEHRVKTSSLPKGVPTPPSTPTTYTVYIGLKQWRKVEPALKDNPDDAIIIEGVCTYDETVPGMVVYANNATTKGLEMAKREAQGQKAPTKAPVSESRPPLPTVPEPPKYPIPPNVPPTVAQKLNDLYSAADQFRQKLAGLDAKPPDQRLGYAMTQKLLKNTEDQIAALERQYKS